MIIPVIDEDLIDDNALLDAMQYWMQYTFSNISTPEQLILILKGFITTYLNSTTNTHNNNNTSIN